MSSTPQKRPESPVVTDNSIIPLKERMDDVYFDLLRTIMRRLGVAIGSAASSSHPGAHVDRDHS